MAGTTPASSRYASLPSPQLVALAVAAVALAVIFANTIEFIVGNWQRPEYSHGYLVPAISGYLIWRRRDRLVGLPYDGCWWGVLVVLLALAVYFVGSLAAINMIDAYALVLTILGLALTFTGWAGLKVIGGPLALLFLMNPVPRFLFNSLSSTLQLWSSQIGVAVIRLFGISVFLEGNVIDLGNYKLQVVEACSGLNYLFPLLTLGFLVVSLVPAKLWIRAVLVLSTIPITILMNSFRIGVIGVLVDRYGTSQAEGFLHDFEGWVVFMLCFGLLLVETWLLMRLTGDRRGLFDLLGEHAGPVSAQTPARTAHRGIGLATIAAVALIVLAVRPAVAIPERVEIHPARGDFTTFPNQVAGWTARRSRIEPEILDALAVDDYLMADYVRSMENPVNFYVAYYASQRTGQTVHSPSSCLPGAGWRMTSFNQHQVPGVSMAGNPLTVNRAEIQLGSQRQLVYYWFQQRGRVLTNEYAVKWYLLWDSLRLNRSDGALVRIMTPVGLGESTASAETRLNAFAGKITPDLGHYIPN